MTNEWGSAFIPDGYEVVTTIPGVRGLHPACTMTYRPALFEHRANFLSDLRRCQDGSAAAKRMAEHIKKYVKAWNLKNDRQQDVDPKDEEAVRTLQPELFEKILDSINGTRPAEEAADVKNSSSGLGSGN